MLLNGWKEISNYVQRGVRTAQRWECLGLPVTRINDSVRSPVIALSEELDQWITRLSKSDPQALVLREIAETTRARLHKQVDVLKRRQEELIRATEQLRKRSLDLRA